MKFEFDEIGMKEEIELMNLQRQMQQNQSNNNQSIGFNMDTLYNLADNEEKQDKKIYIRKEDVMKKVIIDTLKKYKWKIALQVILLRN